MNNFKTNYSNFSSQPYQPYQMPQVGTKTESCQHNVTLQVNKSPSTGLNGQVRHTETMVHFNGNGSAHHRTHLPSLQNSDRRNLTVGRALPLAPEPPPPPAPSSHKASNGGLKWPGSRADQEVDWI